MEVHCSFVSSVVDIVRLSNTIVLHHRDTKYIGECSFHGWMSYSMYTL